MISQPIELLHSSDVVAFAELSQHEHTLSPDEPYGMMTFISCEKLATTT